MTEEPMHHDDARVVAIDCGTAVRRLHDFLDGTLAPMREAEVRAHLETCRGCPPHFDFAAELLHAVALTGVRAGEPAAFEALRARVEAALAAERGRSSP